MSNEVTCLAFMAIFSLFAFLPASLGKFLTWGRGWAASNRDRVPAKELPLWVGRCERAHNNLKDNLPAFAIAVLLVLVTGRATEATALACVVYVVGRLVHFASYGLGLSWARTAGFAAGVFSNVYLVCALFG